MENLVNSISKYQLAINLIPGYIFAILLQRYAHIVLLEGDVLQDAFVSYFFGLIIGRIGSIVVEKLMDRYNKTYKHAPKYDGKIKAERIDPKIEILDRQCTIYRNCCAGCCCVIIGIFINCLFGDGSFSSSGKYILIFLVLTILLVKAMDKQCTYVNKRIGMAISGNLNHKEIMKKIKNRLRMKKLGIITFHRADNYGAVLQAAALQRAIIQMKYRCEILDYDAKIISKNYDVILKTSVIQALKSLLEYKERKHKKQVFDAFRNEQMLFSPPIDKENLEIIADQYDKIITGSDQVWNYNLTASDGAYFLDFVQNSHKKLSYAASFGIGEIPVNKFVWYQDKLADFGHISVREKTGVELVKKITGNNAVNDVDPVFLLKADEWKKMITSRFVEKKYIFAYMLDKVSADYVERLAVAKGMELINLVYSKSYRHPEINVGNCYISLSPADFISCIYYADYVVTGSFHATAFSIIFNKKFIVSVPDNIGSRITDLLDMTELKGRALSTGTYIEGKIDWERVNNIVAKARETSLKNLRESIEA